MYQISNHDQWQKKISCERQSHHVIEVDREAKIRRDADFQTFVQEIGLQYVPRVYLAQFTLTISVRYKNVIAPTLPSIRDKTEIYDKWGQFNFKSTFHTDNWVIYFSLSLKM